MALDSNTTYPEYSNDQINRFVSGFRQTNADNSRKYAKFMKPRYDAPMTNSAIPQYKNINNLVSGQRVGDRVGDMGVITTPYGGQTKFEKSHEAVDIANVANTPITSFTPGVVTEEVNGKKHGEGGFGNYIVVKDDFGNYHRYSHLNQAYIPVNTRVDRGTILGLMGATGNTYSQSGKGKGEHLDYRVYDKNKKKLNPFAFIISNSYNKS